MAAPVLLDLADMQARLGEDDELTRELADSFLGRSQATLDAIRAAVDGGDAKQLELHAHSLKSAIAIFGAFAAVATAQSLEDLGHAKTVDGGARSLLTELEASVRTLEAEIKAVILGS
jgi:HPt (histidine-containing phosphotransfer) domain-containing protein